MTTSTLTADHGQGGEHTAPPQQDAAVEKTTTFIVPDMHCGGCLRTIETSVAALAPVQLARANLSMKSLSVTWHPDEKGDGTPKEDAVLQALQAQGYTAHCEGSLSQIQAHEAAHMKKLIRATALAGFAAANIMLLSVSVWSGAQGATRDLFHWLSALLATPAIAYAGQPFFRPAMRALSARRLNMDVPISLAVLLAYGMSVWETINHGEHAYFDAAVMLLFFLLIGRTLDQAMRARARGAITRLSRLGARHAVRLNAAGEQQRVPVDAIAPGDQLLIRAGDRVPVDGEVVEGTSDLDVSLVTGESAPELARAGTYIRAGVLNLTGALTLRAGARAQQSFLADIVRLMRAAEVSRSGYRRLADRAAAIYAPAVHGIALLTFLAWITATGDWRVSLTTAIAVLIITCPCALGLAVPIVQVVTTGRLFERGIMIKDGAALERLSEVDTVLFDKTGTLTEGKPQIVTAQYHDDRGAAFAVAMAAQSRHPLAQAIAQAARTNDGKVSDNVDNVITVHEATDVAGCGIQGIIDGRTVRLGAPSWCSPHDMAAHTVDVTDWRDNEGVSPDNEGVSLVALSIDGNCAALFRLRDCLREDAATAIEALRRRHLHIGILSGDRAGAARLVGRQLGIDDVAAPLLPGEKVAHLEELHAAGHKTLMVGDGLNDAPSLRAAHVSMAPACAADIGRVAADMIFMHNNPGAIAYARVMAERMKRRIMQNFALAIAYNVIAVPIAVSGLATPLVAAIAMSSSSLLVTANALRR